MDVATVIHIDSLKRCRFSSDTKGIIFSRCYRYPISLLCKTMEVSRGGYYAWRMADEITDHGTRCGRYQAKTVMAMAGVTAKQKRKFKATTDSNHNLPVAPNLLKRNFKTQKPNEVWVGDITYVWTAEGWLYLAVVLDLFSRKVLGWAMSSRIKKCFVITV